MPKATGKVQVAGVFDYHTPAGPLLKGHSGHRLVVLYNEGRKWASVMDVGTLRVRRVLLDEKRHMREAQNTTRHRVAKRLAEKAATYERLGIDFRAETVRAVVRALRKRKG